MYLLYFTISILHLALVSCQDGSDNETIKLTLGLITPPDGQFGFRRLAVATTMAVEHAKMQGYLKGIDVQ